MSGKNSHFSVGECGELMFTKGIVGKSFDLRKNGENGTVKNQYFVPFLPQKPPPPFVPFPSTASRHNPPQPTSRVLCLLCPHFPPISPHILPFPPIFPIFPDSKSWFGELVSSVAVSMVAWWSRAAMHQAQAIA